MRQGRKCGAKWGCNYVLFEKKKIVKRSVRRNAVTARLVLL
jgi:hypothetical protein